MRPFWALLLLVSGQVLSSNAPPNGRQVEEKPKQAVPSDKGARTEVQGEPLPPGAIARLQGVPAKDGGGIDSMAFSPNGKTLVCGEGWTIQMWDVATGKEIRRFKAHKAGVHCLAFSPDGKWFASGGHDGAMRLWETATGRKAREFSGYLVDSLAFSPDGKSLASGCLDRAARLWDVASGRQIRLFQVPQGRVRPVVFSPDGRLLASAGDDQTVHLWEVATGRQLLQLQGWQQVFGPIMFSPDGKILVSAYDDKINLWEVATGEHLLQFQVHPREILFAALSPNGRVLATANAGQHPTICLWELATGKKLVQFTGHTATVEALTFSPDGKSLASGSGDGTVLLWDCTTFQWHKVRGNKNLSLKEVQSCWTDLAGDNAPQAYTAIWTLVAAPKQTVSFFKEHLRPAEPASHLSKQIARLIADLDSDSFAVREKATRDLEDLAEFAESELRNAKAKQPSVEARRRIERLLLKLEGPVSAGARLQGLRALWVLEEIGTPEARQVLESLARGAPESRLTQEAKATLKRLTKPPGHR